MDDQHGNKGGGAATEGMHGAADGLPVTVDGRKVVVSHNADGRGVLEAAGHRPADEHVLIRATHPGSRAISLDERIGHRGGEFFAFRSDRTLSFTIDDKGYVWGVATLPVRQARALAGLGEEYALFMAVKGAPDRELDDEGDIDLSGGGTEHLRTAKAMVTVSYNGVDVQIARGTYTTEQLKATFGVEPGYELDIMEGQHLRTLKPGEKIKVRKGLKFISQVPCGGSS